MINCVIVDDEPLAREGIANYVREVDFLNLVAICENPLELMNIIGAHQVDLIFLDIQMPKMNGIDFLKITQNPPLVIFTTAYPSYAIESYQLNVQDYLLKPITFERFFKAVNRAKEYHQLVSNSESNLSPEPAQGEDYFFIRCGSKYEKIQFDEIIFIEGMQNYVTIYTDKGKYLTLLYLKNLEEKLNNRSFIRVHKSYIVSINKIEGIEGNEIFLKSRRVPLSRNYREQVLQQVVKNKLWIKN